MFTVLDVFLTNLIAIVRYTPMHILVIFGIMILFLDLYLIPYHRRSLMGDYGRTPQRVKKMHPVMYHIINAETVLLYSAPFLGILFLGDLMSLF